MLESFWYGGKLFLKLEDMGVLVVLRSQTLNVVQTHSTKLLCLARLVISDSSVQSCFGGFIIFPCHVSHSSVASLIFA